MSFCYLNGEKTSDQKMSNFAIMYINIHVVEIIRVSKVKLDVELTISITTITDEHKKKEQLILRVIYNLFLRGTMLLILCSISQANCDKVYDV